MVLCSFLPIYAWTQSSQRTECQSLAWSRWQREVSKGVDYAYKERLNTASKNGHEKDDRYHRKAVGFNRLETLRDHRTTAREEILMSCEIASLESLEVVIRERNALNYILKIRKMILNKGNTDIWVETIIHYKVSHAEWQHPWCLPVKCQWHSLHLQMLPRRLVLPRRQTNSLEYDNSIKNRLAKEELKEPRDQLCIFSIEV